MLTLLRTTLDQLRVSRLRRQSRNRAALAEIPATLYPYWKRTACFEFHGIPQDAVFFAGASDALLSFFDCIRRSGKPCALPSRAADSVWHAWSRMAPATLDAFCQRHFGQVIPHLERAAMPVRLGDALANCLVAARRREGLPPAGPQLPSLFVADRTLRMPGGYAYAVVRGQVVLANMDGKGQPQRDSTLQDSLAPAGLLAAGLIGGSEFQRFQERQRGADGGCGSTGASCGSVSCDSDGGGDGGSSGGDGGGCGGGGD